MFETNIGEKAYKGIKLHRKDGTVYWKLRLTCSHEPCPNEIDMGECLCFNTEDLMKRARDDHGMYCCAQHWALNTDEEKIAASVKGARKYLGEMEPEDRDWIIDDMLDDMLVLDAYWQELADAGCYDGSEFYEEYGVDECPI